MGAKTTLLAFTEGDLRPALLGATRSDPEEAAGLVREVYPDFEVTSIEDGSLLDCVFPPDDVTYATVLSGAELFCDRRRGRTRHCRDASVAAGWIGVSG